jgi:nucleoside-diphosphate-sugar epimerase
VRCLVTGAAGFIGSHLADRLLAEGHSVVGLDDLSEGSVDNLATEGVDLVVGDLRAEEVVADAARGVDVIFHQGAVRSIPRSLAEPGLATDVNVRGTLNVLLAARAQGARVVFASSSSVYGDQREFPLHEGLRPDPQSPYAASKLCGEIYCSTFRRSFGVPTVGLRYFNVYGPRQDPSSEYATVVPRFILACLTGERPVIHGDGLQARDFTFVGDAVEANVLAAQASDDSWGRVMNVGGGAPPTSITDLLSAIAELTDTRPEPRFTDPRAGDVRRTHADNKLATDLIGYRPTMSLEDGLRLTVEWFAMGLASQTAVSEVTRGGPPPSGG